jgi:hypothetical protein
MNTKKLDIKSWKNNNSRVVSAVGDIEKEEVEKVGGK